MWTSFSPLFFAQNSCFPNSWCFSTASCQQGVVWGSYRWAHGGFVFWLSHLYAFLPACSLVWRARERKRKGGEQQSEGAVCVQQQFALPHHEQKRSSKKKNSFHTMQSEFVYTLMHTCMGEHAAGVTLVGSRSVSVAFRALALWWVAPAWWVMFLIIPSLETLTLALFPPLRWVCTFFSLLCLRLS